MDDFKIELVIGTDSLLCFVQYENPPKLKFN